MIKADIKHKDSIKENLDVWCYERGTRFEIVNEEAAKEFMNILDSTYNDILDLGCGDGAASQYFVENGLFVIGIDINEEKINKYPGLGITIDMYEYLTILKDDSVMNIFTHHALEHTVKAKEVIKEIGRVLMPGGIYYAIVPAQDYLHTVHHVVFESAEELLPPGLIPLTMLYQDRHEPEFKCIAYKP